jgi:hypothetical protein
MFPRDHAASSKSRFSFCTCLTTAQKKSSMHAPAITLRKALQRSTPWYRVDGGTFVMRNLAAQGADVSTMRAAISNLISTAREPIAAKAAHIEASYTPPEYYPPDVIEGGWLVTPEILADELDRMQDAFNREILAAQLRREGSGAGPVAAFIADVDQLLTRYYGKVDGIAGRGGVVGDAKATLLSLANAVKATATNDGAVDVPVIS